MRVFGPRATIEMSRESSGTCKGFFTAYGSPSTSIFAECALPVLSALQDTLGGDCDIFAASGESTAWVLLWKTRSRPIGVRVCPAAQFNFFSTSFDPRKWTMVVF